MATLKINPGASLDNAKEIDTIVDTIRQDLEKLNTVINSQIPDNVRTDWSDELKANWVKYYQADVPVALENMQVSADNLRLAVNEAINYSAE